MVKQKLMIISERFGINFRIFFSVDLCGERKESTVNKRYSKHQSDQRCNCKMFLFNCFIFVVFAHNFLFTPTVYSS